MNGQLRTFLATWEKSSDDIALNALERDLHDIIKAAEKASDTLVALRDEDSDG